MEVVVVHVNSRPRKRAQNRLQQQLNAAFIIALLSHVPQKISVFLCDWVVFRLNISVGPQRPCAGAEGRLVQYICPEWVHGLPRPLG